MGGDAGAHHGRGDQADLVGVGLDAELVDVVEALVERPLVPETVLRTADAAVARLDREGHAVVPAHGGAGVVGGRPLAAHLVEAEALARVLVVPLLDELAGVEMRAAVAFVVDALRIEHLRPALAVEFGQPAEGVDEGDDAGHDLGDRRAARHLDDRLVGDDLVDRRGLRRVGLGRLHAAPGGAGAPGDHRHGVGGHFLELLDEGTAAVDAEHAVFVQRRIAFDREDVLALVFFAGLLEDRFGLMARRRHDGVVIVERNHRQHHILHQRMRGADEAFRAAGAFQPVHPDHGHARLGFQRLRHLGGAGRAQAHAGGGKQQNLVKFRRVIPCRRITS